MRLASVATALLLVSSAALADWQAVQWNMTPDAVIAAGGGEIAAAKDEPGKRIQNNLYLAFGTATVDGIEYKLDYFFRPKDRQLVMINYTPAEQDCDAALASHTKRLGDGKAKVDVLKGPPNRPPIVTTKHFWTSPASGDQIESVDVAVKEFGIRYCQFLHSP